MKSITRVALAALLVGLVPVVGCPKPSDDKADEDKKDKKDKKKDKDDDDDDDKDKDKDKKADKDKDKDKDKDTKPASEEKDIDVDSILEGETESAGVLSNTDLKGIDTKGAPNLGKNTAQSNETIKTAQWLTLPGDVLQIPEPTGWSKKKEGNVGFLISPDEKAFMLFTTFKTEEEVKTLLNKVGELAKITKVDWKKPKTVKIGEDELPAFVRGGDFETATEKGDIAFALIETGIEDKVMALAMKSSDAPEAIGDAVMAILTSTRKKR